MLPTDDRRSNVRSGAKVRRQQHILRLCSLVKKVTFVTLTETGRSFEPQQMNNLRSGKPAGPMQDKETIPHPAPEHKESKFPSSHANEKHH